MPLPAQVPPPSFTAEVPTLLSSVTINFTAHPLRSANFGVLVQHADGSFAGFNMPTSRIYIGTVQGHPGALAVGLLKENGNLFTKVAFENGVEWSSAVGLTIVRGGTNWAPAWPTSTLGAGGAGSVVYEAEVGIDLTHRYYLDAGSNVRNAVEMAEYSVMSVNLAFVRDAGILHTVGKVVVRANQGHCPYFPMTSHNQWLNEVGTQWNTVIPVGATHDLALVATPPGGAGVAWLGAVGSNIRYSSNGSDPSGDFSGVLRHEVGHNWGANHYEGGGNPEGDTIMSNNSLYRFSSSELVPIIAHRDSRLGVLDNLGNYAVPLPPRANQDRAIVSPDPAASVTIDVLANDSDANGDPLTIQSFEGTTAMGRSVTRSVGTGASGRDQLTYSSPTALVSGTDWFSYRIVDATGRTATSWVMLRPFFDEELLAHWTMDESSGPSASDTTMSARDGVVQGGSSWTAGKIGGAVLFDGIDDHIVTHPLDHAGNALTFTGWLRRSGSQPGWAGIIFCRGTAATAGLNFGPANELRFHWDAGSNPSWTYNSGLVPPDGVWTFVALVVSHSSATVYMKPDGGSLQTATANGTFNPQSLSSGLYLGRDPGWDQLRSFRGALDDVRVFRRSLTAMEIASLANLAGTPANPTPAITSARVLGLPTNLAWRQPPGATSYRIYLGHTYSGVRNANLASPEYRGMTTSPAFSAGKLGPGDWFWRVDCTDGNVVFPGPVWFFTVVAGKHSLAVNFSNGDTGASTVAPGQDTDALNAATGLMGPVTWHNQAIAGAGALANGRGSGSYSGVNVLSFSANAWQVGANNLAGDDASQRVFHTYLDDGEGGNGFFNGDGVGASIHVSGITQYLLENGAQSYALTLYFNRDVGNTIFRPATIRQSVPIVPSAGAIPSLPLLGTITATLLGNGQQPLPVLGGATEGTRGWGEVRNLTADAITISLPSWGAGRGTIAGFAITPDGPIISGRELWRVTHFEADAGNEEIAGDLADPNGDGVSNLMAYAMGIDPLKPPVPGATAAQLGHPKLIRITPGFHLTYQRNLLATDVQLVLEQTSELNHPTVWMPAVVTETQAGEVNNIRTINVSFTPELGENRRFLRFRVQ